MRRTLVTTAAIWSVAVACTATPYADFVVQYTPGVDADKRYDDPNAALGEPTRFTSPESMYGGAVTPFNPPFGFDEVVSIGHGLEHRLLEVERRA